MTDIVMDEYRFLLRLGHNYKGGELIHIAWLLGCMLKSLDKRSWNTLSNKVLASIEKIFEGLPLAPIVIVD